MEKTTTIINNIERLNLIFKSLNIMIGFINAPVMIVFNLKLTTSIFYGKKPAMFELQLMFAFHAMWTRSIAASKRSTHLGITNVLQSILPTACHFITMRSHEPNWNTTHTRCRSYFFSFHVSKYFFILIPHNFYFLLLF